MVELPYQTGLILDHWHLLPREVGAADELPALRNHVAYFAFLFLVLRWWRSTDPLRWARLSLWNVFVTLVFAWLMCNFWDYPMPWGLIVAGTTSVAIQLASPWQHTRNRAVIALAD
jgi:hypothetical protein